MEIHIKLSQLKKMVESSEDSRDKRGVDELLFGFFGTFTKEEISELIQLRIKVNE